LNQEAFIDWWLPDEYNMRSSDVIVEKEDFLPVYMFNDYSDDDFEDVAH